MMDENDKLWQMEHYCPYPNIRTRFTVIASTFEEAVQKGDEAINKLYRTATYDITNHNKK